jgi:nitrogen fixation NifU-like protein
VEAKFKTFGCGAAIATSSILTERIIGATLDEALKISEETSKEVLAQLPKEKVPCFTLATDALKLAIEEFRCKRTGVHEKGGFDMGKVEKDLEEQSHDKRRKDRFSQESK